MSANYELIINNLIYGRFGAFRNLDSGRMVCNSCNSSIILTSFQMDRWTEDTFMPPSPLPPYCKTNPQKALFGFFSFCSADLWPPFPIFLNVLQQPSDVFLLFLVLIHYFHFIKSIQLISDHTKTIHITRVMFVF